MLESILQYYLPDAIVGQMAERSCSSSSVIILGQLRLPTSRLLSPLILRVYGSLSQSLTSYVIDSSPITSTYRLLLSPTKSWCQRSSRLRCRGYAADLLIRMPQISSSSLRTTSASPRMVWPYTWNTFGFVHRFFSMICYSLSPGTSSN